MLNVLRGAPAVFLVHQTARLTIVVSLAVGASALPMRVTAAQVPPTQQDTGRRPKPALDTARRVVPPPDSARRSAPARPPTSPADSAAPVVVAPKPQPGQLSRPLRVCAGGDVTLGTNLDTAWARKAHARMRDLWRMSDDPDSLLAPLKPLLTDADVVLLNVEGAIGAGYAPRKCAKRAQNCYAFRQPVSAARALRAVAESSVVVGNIANNHSHDAGPEGLDATRTHLRRAGVRVTGADTLATPVVVSTGDTIAVLGFHTSEDTPDARDLAAVYRHVKRAVDRYGVVIVTMHLGAEGEKAQRTRDTTEIFLQKLDRGNPVAFANAALAAGATLVVGHGPHVLRAAEWRGTRLILYSLGNLLTYGPFGLKEPMSRGAVACMTIDSAGVVSEAALKSTMQLAPGILRADSTGRAARLVDSLSALDFPRSGVQVDTTGVLRQRDVESSRRPPLPPR
jgi:Bacterial capsule synthesis protein PGA_cap